MDSKVLIITGMHRSGTSLIAEYLSKCGLFVGKDLLNLATSSKASAYNGHHEDKAFFELHDQMLKRLHISPFPRYQFRLTNRFTAQENRLAKALIEERKYLSQWGWKDPRTALFLKAWHRVIPEAKHLLLIRNPLSVVDSLVRRGTDQQVVDCPLVGLQAWRVYNKRILIFLKEHPDSCLLCDIDELIAQPQSICTLIEQQLSLVLSPVAFESVFSKKGFRVGHSEAINQLKIKHNREVTAASKLYEELRSVANGYSQVSTGL
ncbi:MAG: hypothetical protein HC799_14780 [Limnothrix sp. RL_2_0]|nr:hypothetical protein [Limnothrix sp. RL_2_0]